MSKYAPADSKTQWFEDQWPGSPMKPNTGVLHTTESVDWPDYAGGSEAPTYTAKPLIKLKRFAWRQHFPDERSARALVNKPGGVETNTLNCLQVELVGTCDPKHKDTWAHLRAGVDYIYWPDAPDWALEELAHFMAYCNRRHGIKVEAPKFEAYPASYGASNGVRFNFHQWLNFYGWCGHMHVPENLHGDPGSIDITTVVSETEALLKPAPPAPAPPPAQDALFIEYNLSTPGGRGKGKAAAQKDVTAEAHAILNAGFNGVVLTEAIGWHLPVHPDYDRTLDRTKPGRADVVMYLRKDRHLSPPIWNDEHETWGRTKHKGTHPARSTLRRSYGGMQVVAAHLPPQHTDNVIASQQEVVDVLTRVMAPWTRAGWLSKVVRLVRRRQRRRGRIVLGDMNRVAAASVNLPGPHMLADRIGGQVVGDKIDCAVTVNLDATAQYVRRVGGVHLGSDHKHAVVVHVKG